MFGFSLVLIFSFKVICCVVFFKTLIYEVGTLGGLVD